eukprot:COSAG02_NODE_7356_length_3048_cov_8.873177_3_plen_89_part_00
MGVFNDCATYEKTLKCASHSTSKAVHLCRGVEPSKHQQVLSHMPIYLTWRSRRAGLMLQPVHRIASERYWYHRKFHASMITFPQVLQA